jgi:alpha-D-ribose 1-methylphosphonate 5-triphosphate synthase subunit PhnH
MANETPFYRDSSQPDGVPVPGFADTVLGTQETFRAVLDAMARPGQIVEAGAGLSPPAPLHAAAGAVALTLFDYDTPIWLDSRTETAALCAFLRFHCGCPLVDAPEDARFALVGAPRLLPEIVAFDLGDDAFPERSATLILQTEGLTAGDGLRLTGPGIETEHRLKIAGLPSTFWRERARSQVLFPRGIDLILTDGDRLAALPRTTLVEA